jgi:hypothetical protein
MLVRHEPDNNNIVCGGQLLVSNGTCYLAAAARRSYIDCQSLSRPGTISEVAERSHFLMLVSKLPRHGVRYGKLRSVSVVRDFDKASRSVRGHWSLFRGVNYELLFPIGSSPFFVLPRAVRLSRS